MVPFNYGAARVGRSWNARREPAPALRPDYHAPCPAGGRATRIRLRARCACQSPIQLHAAALFSSSRTHHRWPGTLALLAASVGAIFAGRGTHVSWPFGLLRAVVSAGLGRQSAVLFAALAAYLYCVRRGSRSGLRPWAAQSLDRLTRRPARAIRAWPVIAAIPFTPFPIGVDASRNR